MVQFFNDARRRLLKPGAITIPRRIETFIAPAKNPPAEAIALDGLRRASRHIERAVADGRDREARWEMMTAAMEGAMAFQKGLGAVHALSHPLGSLEDLKLHHGTLNAVILRPRTYWKPSCIRSRTRGR